MDNQVIDVEKIEKILDDGINRAQKVLTNDKDLKELLDTVQAQIDAVPILKSTIQDGQTLFELIQSQSNTDWDEMYKVFNMGHRMELYLPEKYAQEVIEISRSFDVDAQIVGHVEESEERSLVIESSYGKHFYK